MTATRRISAERRINYAWGLLSGLTALGWGLAQLRSGRITASAPETIAVLAIAGVKARLIMQEYMEVRTAPIWLRRTSDAWLVGLLLTIGVMYLYA